MDMEEFAILVAEMAQRIVALEARVTELEGRDE
jgi:hypothetical protein